MSFFIRDPATDEAVRRLAKLRNQTLTEAIHQAAESEYQRERAKVPLIERLNEISRLYKETPESGLKADKAFFDELSGDI